MIIIISVSQFSPSNLQTIKNLLMFEIIVACIIYWLQGALSEPIILSIVGIFVFVYEHLRFELAVLKSDLLKENEESIKLKKKIEHMKLSKIPELPIRRKSPSKKNLIDKLKLAIRSKHSNRALSFGSANSNVSFDENKAPEEFTFFRAFSEESNSDETPRSNNPELSETELQDIVQLLLTQELINWQKKAELSPEESIKFLGELQEKYTQSNREMPGMSHRVFKIKKIRKMPSMLEANEVLAELLDIGDWDIDLLDTVKITKRPVYEIGYYVFSTLGIIEQLDIPISQLKNFLAEVDRCYKPANYYHNSIHAADVTCSVVFLLHNCLQRCGNLLDLDIFALLTASICHDISHPGYNNSFLIANEHKLAMKYNDQSVLENMHSSLTFDILKRPNCNIVSSLSKSDFQAYRKIVILTILATDLQKHFDKQKEFSEQINKRPVPTLENDDFRHLALQMVLKCSDLGHGAKTLKIHQKWTGLITKEFFVQGDREIELGMTVSPLCDRATVILCKSQVGFLNFLVQPLFKLLENYVVILNEDDDTSLHIKTCCKNIENNVKFWESEARRIDSGQEPTYILDSLPPPLL